MFKYFMLLIHSDAAPVRTASTRQTFVDERRIYQQPLHKNEGEAASRLSFGAKMAEAWQHRQDELPPTSKK